MSDKNYNKYLKYKQKLSKDPNNKLYKKKLKFYSNKKKNYYYDDFSVSSIADFLNLIILLYLTQIYYQ